MSGRTKTFDEQFWPKIEFDPNGGCWLWTGGMARANGYGRMWDSDAKDTRGAHQVSYERFVGPVPKGLQLDHKCRVRCCVNPEHLEAVTSLENVTRSLEATGKRERCPKGHPYTPANTGFQFRRGCAGRYCRECRREYRKTHPRHRQPLICEVAPCP